MGIRKTLITLLLTGALATGLTSKVNASPVLWDDFSSGKVDPQKWMESFDKYQGRPFTDTHEVRSIGGNNAYYAYQAPTPQSSITGGETDLTPLRQFNNGESLSYDVEFRNGSGLSYFTQILVNDISGKGMIGWNGSAGFFGDNLGKYQILNQFCSDHVDINCTRPDGSVVTDTIRGLIAPYTITFNTFADRGTAVGFTFDNFYVTSVPEPSTAGLFGLGGALLLLKKLKRRNKLAQKVEKESLK